MGERYDVAVVGGGIVGAAVARDAALRGLRVVLFEAGDFAGGASGRTSRLMHGGLRDLDRLAWRPAREALEERSVLLRVAPHLVWPAPFLLPFHRGQNRWRWFLETGLHLHQRLAGTHRLAPPRHLGAAQALALEPELPRAGLQGAVLFTDARADDARLCLENALDAAALGADLFTRREVVEVARGASGVRLRAHDTVAVEEPAIEIEAAVVVNATGPWVDHFRRRAGVRGRRLLRHGRSAHLVVPALTRRHGLLLPAHDGRYLFVLPEGERSLVGTAESAYRGDPEACRATARDVGYLFREVRGRWPSRSLSTQEVRRAYASVRPLPAIPLPGFPHGERIVMEDGLASVVAGSFTTYRATAERALDRVLAATGKQARPCATRERPLPGAGAGPRAQAAAQGRARALELRNLGAADAERLGARYGGLLAGAALLVEQYPAVHDRAGARILEGEVVYAVRHEMARCLDDVLLRRLDLWTDRHALRHAAAPVARWMADHLGWPHARAQQEVRRLEEALDAEERVVAGWGQA